MLESLHIKNFRSCEDTQIRLGEPVIALVGKNGVGKTNVLHAIQLVADLCVGESESVFRLQPRDRAVPVEFVLGFTNGTSRYSYSFRQTNPTLLTHSLGESFEKDGRVLFSRSGEFIESMEVGYPPLVKIGGSAASISTLLQILPQSSPAIADLKPVAEYLRSIRYYPLLQGFQEHSSDVSPFIEASHYDKWKVLLSQGKIQRSVQLRLLHMGLTDTERFDELKTLLGENGLGLIADMRIEEVKNRRPDSEKADEAVEQAYSISFMPGLGLAGSGRWFRFNGLSAGTLRTVHLLTCLVFDKTSCMLLEQPEDCIHLGLLSKVIDILRTYSGRMQLVCTTHSPRVMNLVGASGIRFVEASEGRTAVSELSLDQVKAAESYLADEGTLAEFFGTL